jgi:hypothetical protein
LQVTSGREGQRRRKEGRFARFQHCQRRRVASDGDAVEHALPAFLHEFLQFLKHFLCNSWSFEDCFVKFELFDVIFIYFLNIIICIVNVKRKEKKKKITKKKKKKKKKRETKMYVCIYFRDFL